MKVNNIIENIGNTPLIRLNNISSGNIYAKAEFMNPGGSIKDRVAKGIIENAEAEGKLKPGMTIIEATSGNTGIGLSLAGVQKGYKVVCVMPENMSEERRRITQCLGGEIIITPAERILDGCIEKMQEIVAQNPEQYFIANQFTNPANPQAHYTATGPEIWKQTGGEIDMFVAGVGSGGSIQGIGTYLKEQNPGIKIIAVEPKNSAALLGKEPGLHKIQGIGDGFIPEILDVNIIDSVITVSDDEAIETTRQLARQEGVLAGTSSGANVFAALSLDNNKNRIVTLLVDRIERYFSTALL